MALSEFRFYGRIEIALTRGSPVNKATPCTGSAREARRTHAWRQSHTPAAEMCEIEGNRLAASPCGVATLAGGERVRPHSANRNCKRPRWLLGATNAKPKRAFHEQNAGEPGAVRRRSNEPGGLSRKPHTRAQKQAVETPDPFRFPVGESLEEGPVDRPGYHGSAKEGAGRVGQPLQPHCAQPCLEIERYAGARVSGAEKVRTFRRLQYVSAPAEAEGRPRPSDRGKWPAKKVHRGSRQREVQGQLALRRSRASRATSFPQALAGHSRWPMIDGPVGTSATYTSLGCTLPKILPARIKIH